MRANLVILSSSDISASMPEQCPAEAVGGIIIKIKKLFADTKGGNQKLRGKIM